MPRCCSVSRAMTCLQAVGSPLASACQPCCSKPGQDEAKRLDLRDRLNKIPGVEIPADAITRRPTIPLAVLTNDAALKAFLGVLDWYIAEVKAG